MLSRAESITTIYEDLRSEFSGKANSLPTVAVATIGRGVHTGRRLGL